MRVKWFRPCQTKSAPQAYEDRRGEPQLAFSHYASAEPKLSCFLAPYTEKAIDEHLTLVTICHPQWWRPRGRTWYHAAASYLGWPGQGSKKLQHSARLAPKSDTGLNSFARHKDGQFYDLVVALSAHPHHWRIILPRRAPRVLYCPAGRQRSAHEQHNLLEARHSKTEGVCGKYSSGWDTINRDCVGQPGTMNLPPGWHTQQPSAELLCQGSRIQ